MRGNAEPYEREGAQLGGPGHERGTESVVKASDLGIRAAVEKLEDVYSHDERERVVVVSRELALIT